MFNENKSQDRPQPKRKRRRLRHDLPGPAGAWLRRNTPKNSATTNTDIPDWEDAGSTTATTNSGSRKMSNNNHNPLHSAGWEHLHDSNAWNSMCCALDRIVGRIDCNSLRQFIPENYALIHEIHTGKYDTIFQMGSPSCDEKDLRVPLLIGYVASVQCNAHSDWTAVLIDESFMINMDFGFDASTDTAKRSNVGRSLNCARGIVCWLEERVVKEHISWIRPGVVWMLEGAKLALFSSKDDEDEAENEDGNYACSVDPVATNTTVTTEIERIDRMILVGESTLVGAWTPEESALRFTHQDFVRLMERRCNAVTIKEKNLDEIKKDKKKVSATKVSAEIKVQEKRIEKTPIACQNTTIEQVDLSPTISTKNRMANPFETTISNEEQTLEALLYDERNESCVLTKQDSSYSSFVSSSHLSNVRRVKDDKLHCGDRLEILSGKSNDDKGSCPMNNDLTHGTESPPLKNSLIGNCQGTAQMSILKEALTVRGVTINKDNSKPYLVEPLVEQDLILDDREHITFSNSPLNNNGSILRTSRASVHYPPSCTEDSCCEMLHFEEENEGTATVHNKVFEPILTKPATSMTGRHAGSTNTGQISLENASKVSPICKQINLNDVSSAPAQMKTNEDYVIYQSNAPLNRNVSTLSSLGKPVSRLQPPPSLFDSIDSLDEDDMADLMEEDH